MATIPDHPSFIVVTDYPDEHILGNLKRNVDHNRRSFQHSCDVRCAGYEWGTDAEPLLKLLPTDGERPRGYDIMILSDLLHFHSSHDVLIASINSLLSRSKDARVHVSVSCPSFHSRCIIQTLAQAGKYTHRDVCDDFLLKCQGAGLIFEEIHVDSDEADWKGKMTVAELDKDSLAVRKGNCYYWIGQWSQPR